MTKLSLFRGGGGGFTSNALTVKLSSSMTIGKVSYTHVAQLPPSEVGHRALSESQLPEGICHTCT